ncbi:DUF6146 family protein [Maribacter sp.]|uniref:DUF6146 family protein n=1 Tax=Maribacter sp. TaxID=1897614 RepID=UPI0025C52C06|nr:DUF6146 family protein [Maribacter sp.]
MKKNILYTIVIGLISFLIWSCNSTSKAISISDKEKTAFTQTKGDTITISSDKTEYEITIIESGYNFWLQSTAKAKGYYSQSYMENRNQIYVAEWNRRVLQPQVYDSNLYELQIDYQAHIDYGYDVNYKLYNYFIYFQRKYNQRLGAFLPRI